MMIKNPKINLCKYLLTCWRWFTRMHFLLQTFNWKNKMPRLTTRQKEFRKFVEEMGGVMRASRKLGVSRSTIWELTSTNKTFSEKMILKIRKAAMEEYIFPDYGNLNPEYKDVFSD